jgi:hypothetical protein
VAKSRVSDGAVREVDLSQLAQVRQVTAPLVGHVARVQVEHLQLGKACECGMMSLWLLKYRCWLIEIGRSSTAVLGCVKA